MKKKTLDIGKYMRMTLGSYYYNTWEGLNEVAKICTIDEEKPHEQKEQKTEDRSRNRNR